MPVVKSFKVQVVKRLEADATRLVTKAAVAYTNEVKRLMIDSPRGGRTYSVSRVKKGRKTRGPGRVHKASAPGEPPAVNRGDLLRSIGFKITTVGGRIIADCGSRLKGIPFWLEYGTKRIAPRPAWRPALVVPKKILGQLPGVK